MSWYLTVVKDNYFNFKGRASRKEYWMFGLIHLIIIAITFILDNVLGTTITSEQKNFFSGDVTLVSQPYGYIYCLYALLTIMPAFGVTVRRFHDTGVGVKTALFNFFNIFGLIWYIVKMFSDSDHEENQYGPSPKYTEPEENE